MSIKSVTVFALAAALLALGTAPSSARTNVADPALETTAGSAASVSQNPIMERGCGCYRTVRYRIVRPYVRFYRVQYRVVRFVRFRYI